MSFPLYIDASMLKDAECKEFLRQRYHLNRDTACPNLYYEYGKIVHFGVECFWKGMEYASAMAKCYELTNLFPVKMISHDVYKSNKWREMVDQLPDLLSVYWDAVEQDLSLVQQIDGKPALENEWQFPYSSDVILCGRIDRVMVGPELPDVKTASEIASMGVPWKQGYQKGKMLEVQFGLYDWYLGQIGLAPRRVYLEVLVKGYRGKAPRYEVIELPYVTTEAYRERFKQQLAWKVSEIVDYFKNKTEQQPWPMSQSLCQTKYGECPYIAGCLNSWTPKVLELYKIREEHLDVRK